MLRADIIYGLLYWPTIRPAVEFLRVFPETFPNTDGGKLFNSYNLKIQHTGDK